MVIREQASMQTAIVDAKLHRALIRYRHHYLNKNLENLDESSTRVIINHLLSDVLGYKELIDIKTEYPIRGGFIDYLIELRNRKVFVVEAKSINTKLTNKHLRQAVYYGATIGSDWIILTNARIIDLYKIKFTKPIKIDKIFSLDLKKVDIRTQKFISLISKRSIRKSSLDEIFSKLHSV